MSEEEKTQTEETEKTKQQDEKWDKERQRIDQAEANVRKLTEQLATAESDKGDLSERIATLEKAQEKAGDDISLDALDPDLVGQAIPANFSKLTAEIKRLKEQHAILDAKAKAYEEERALAEEKQRRKEAEEKVLTPLDDKYGAKFRTQAVRLANRKIEDGEEKQPLDQLDTRDLMEKCYQELSEKAKEKESTATDSGKGGVSATEGVKEGSLEEVRAQLEKKGLGSL